MAAERQRIALIFVRPAGRHEPSSPKRPTNRGGALPFDAILERLAQLEATVERDRHFRQGGDYRRLSHASPPS